MRLPMIGLLWMPISTLSSNTAASAAATCGPGLMSALCCVWKERRTSHLVACMVACERGRHCETVIVPPLVHWYYIRAKAFRVVLHAMPHARLPVDHRAAAAGRGVTII